MGVYADRCKGCLYICNNLPPLNVPDPIVEAPESLSSLLEEKRVFDIGVIMSDGAVVPRILIVERYHVHQELWLNNVGFENRCRQLFVMWVHVFWLRLVSTKYNLRNCPRPCPHHSGVDTLVFCTGAVR